MARTKRSLRPNHTEADSLILTEPTTSIQGQDEDVKNESDQSDSPPSPILAKTSTPPAKRKARKDRTTKTTSEIPAVASSPALTPQSDQTPRRKGGNKRKWTHEYCLTCTRYGRACGGRREGEEGCAVCRDPDRAKGEKLRECLWADHEAGITDYKTARQIFKKAQAEARAQRAKPPGNKRQSSAGTSLNSATPRQTNTVLRSPISTAQYHVAAADLPQTTRPLNLLPPTLVRPSHSMEDPDHLFLEGDDEDTVVVDHTQLAVHPSMATASFGQLPRIHRPRLTYVTIQSDDEDKNTNITQKSRTVDTSKHDQVYDTHQASSFPSTYFNADPNAWLKPGLVRAQAYKVSSRFYEHPYRSPYDGPPAPISPSVHQADPVCSLDTPRRASYVARAQSSPSSLALDKSGSPSRKWSVEGSKIASFNGYNWKTKAWKPADDFIGGEVEHSVGNTKESEDNMAILSDSSSLSSYMSLEEDTAGNAEAVVSRGQDRTTDMVSRGELSEQSNSIDCIEPPSKYLKRTHQDMTTSSGRHSQKPSLGTYPVERNQAVLRLNLAGPVSNVRRLVSSHAENNKSSVTFEQPVALTFPSEITIQKDEEAGSSDSDSDLTSDEGKLKSLPPKLRKVLSRSRITKVIIGDDIFEIRPKPRPSEAKVEMKARSAGEMIRSEVRSKSQKHTRKPSRQVLTAGFEDDASGMTKTTEELARIEGTEAKAKHMPIKIKLIFNRKPTADSHGGAEA